MRLRRLLLWSALLGASFVLHLALSWQAGRELVPQAAGEAAQLELRVGPLERPEQADNLIDLFKEITDLGTIEPIDGMKLSRNARMPKTLASSRPMSVRVTHTRIPVMAETAILMPTYFRIFSTTSV